MAWANLCSEPLAGREEPAMLMATPLEIRALTTILTDSSSPGRMSAARSTIMRAVIPERAEAYSLYSSPLSRLASCQSRRAV